ncbi:transposase [Streptococcus pneumoniae]|nr:transposase [Streptococcus pneumoniae]
MRSKLWATLEKKNHTYYEQDPEKVALFLKNFNSLKHLAPVYIDETGFDTYFYREYGRSLILCEEFGHKLLPLPPYSPEYNPIEKTWAHIKKHLKKVLPSCNTFYESLLSCSCFN